MSNANLRRINNPERARTVFHALVFGAKNSGKVCEESVVVIALINS